MRRFEKEADEDVRKLLRILISKPWQRTWSDEEREAFQQVKEIRRIYLASNERVTIRDYGAGKPGSNRSPEEIKNGVEITRSISKVCRSAAISVRWGKLIFTLIREFQPEHCLELGTSLGISAAYQISALKLNKKGSLITIEGAESIAGMADENLKKLNYPHYSVQQGRFKEVLPTILSGNRPVDFAFIDGHHNRMATKEYFEMINPCLAKRSILIFDDIHWSKGMRAVWKEISTDSRITFAVDLRRWGVCLTK